MVLVTQNLTGQHCTEQLLVRRRWGVGPRGPWSLPNLGLQAYWTCALETVAALRAAQTSHWYH